MEQAPHLRRVEGQELIDKPERNPIPRESGGVERGEGRAGGDRETEECPACKGNCFERIHYIGPETGFGVYMLERPILGFRPMVRSAPRPLWGTLQGHFREP